MTITLVKDGRHEGRRFDPVLPTSFVQLSGLDSETPL
jgi:hypothetical protein